MQSILVKLKAFLAVSELSARPPYGWHQRFSQALENALTARAGIRAILECSVELSLSARLPRFLAATDGPSDNKFDPDGLLRLKDGILELICLRLHRGVREGDLAADSDIEQLASFYFGIMQIIALRASEGEGRRELEVLIEPALAALR